MADGHIILRTEVDSSGLKNDAKKLSAEFENATRGDLKRAIKCLREVQSRFSSPEDIDGAVELLRRDFLRKEPA